MLWRHAFIAARAAWVQQAPWLPCARGIGGQTKRWASTAATKDDDYRWLQQLSPRTLMWMQQQSDRLATYIAPHTDKCADLYVQLQALMPKASEAHRTEYYGRFRYVLSDPANPPVKLYQDAPNGTRKVVLEHPGTVQQVFPSADGKRVAWLAPSDGARGEATTLHVRDVRSGRLLAQWPNAMAVQWPGRSDHIMLTTGDARGRPHKVWLLRLPERFAKRMDEPRVVLEEVGDAQFVDVTLTKDERLVLLHAHSKSTSEIHMLSPSHLDSPPRCVLPRQQGLQYMVEHWRGWLLLLTNAPGAAHDGEHGVMLCRAPTDAELIAEQGPWCASASQWVPLISPSVDGVVVEQVDVMDSTLVLYGRRDGVRPVVGLLPLDEARLTALHANPDSARPAVQWVDAPPWVASMSPTTNAVPGAPVVRVAASSPVHHEQLCELSLADGTWHSDGAIEPATCDGRLYARQTLWATSGDGTRVPITLTCAHDGQQPRPTLVEVYGAYGHCADVSYNAGRALLLQLGFNVAVAHVRGGGELGRRWHLDGVGAHKQRGVDDAKACIEELIARGLVKGSKVALQATSGGGIVAGALLNQYPHLLCGLVASVPFVDLVGGMSNPALPLTVHEYDEHGDPRQPEALAAMQAVCPVSNVQAQAYPPVLVSASMDDTRVPYWGPCAWVAKLQAAQTEGGAPVLLCLSKEGGHFGFEEDGGETCVMQTAFLLDAAKAC